MTRIFEVEYDYTPTYDGKAEGSLEDKVRVVAKDAEQAISKARAKTSKPYTFFDEEKKRRVKVSCKTFVASSVNLLAEA